MDGSGRWSNASDRCRFGRFEDESRVLMLTRVADLEIENQTNSKQTKGREPVCGETEPWSAVTAAWTIQCVRLAFRAD